MHHNLDVERKNDIIEIDKIWLIGFGIKIKS